MSVRRTHRSRRLRAALILAAPALLLAGCGSSQSSGTAADPAGAVPATAPVYASAIVRPPPALKAAALAAGQALTHQSNPYLRLLGALQTPGSPTLSFKGDVAPWLGARAGVFLSSAGPGTRAAVAQLLGTLLQGLLGGSTPPGGFSFGAHAAQGAIVLDTRDAHKARSFLDSQAARAGAHAGAYRGVSYRATAGGLAFGLVDRFAVIGSESALRSVIDTTLGGPSLARAPGYSRLLSSAPSGALAHLYADPGAFAAPAGVAQGPPDLFALLGGERLQNISLVPSATAIMLDLDTPPAVESLLGSPTVAPRQSAGSGGLLSSAAEGAQAASELPAESWLAIGLGDVGKTLASDVQGLHALISLSGSGAEGRSSPGISVKGLLEGILAPLNALGANTPQARRDFQSWMGSAGIFASGSGLLDLKAAVVISSTNPGASRAAVAKLALKLRQAGGSIQSASIPGTDAAVAARVGGLPVALDIADGRAAGGQTKFVIGLGEASVGAALNPSGTLSGTPSYAAAGAALGNGIQPSIALDFPTFLGLLEGVGLNEDPTISALVPYLRSLTTLAGGGMSLPGGVQRYRLVLGLRPGG